MPSLYFILPLISVVAIYVVRLVEIGTKRETIAGKIRENLTLRLFLLAGTVIFFGSIAEFIWLRPRLWWPSFVAGWICAIVSFSLRRRAIAALGRFWSLHVEIRENHEFVQTGPFSRLRHPAYFSMILELLALALICNAFFVMLLIPLFFFPVLLMRLRIEEAALVEKFGDRYREYQKSTPALFPWKW